MAQSRRGTPDPGPPLNVVTIHRTPVDRAYELARSGCSDAEVAATLIAETDLDPDEAEQMVAAAVMSRRLAAEREAGRGQLRSYLHSVATTPNPTAATLQVSMWLSRQTLGYGTKGLGEDLERAFERLEQMGADELRDHLRKVADGL